LIVGRLATGRLAAVIPLERTQAVLAPRTVRRTVIAGALVVGLTAAGVTSVAMMLADAVLAGQGNGYGYTKGRVR
jgi:hypothetical protein